MERIAARNGATGTILQAADETGGHQAGQPTRREGKADASPLVRLLRVEGDARAAKSLAELEALIGNETQPLLRARQTFVARRGILGRLEISAGAGLSRVDRNAPLIQSIEAEFSRFGSDAALDSTRQTLFWPDAEQVGDGELAQKYPFRQALWIPVLDPDRSLYCGVLLLRDTTWEQHDIVVAQRLSATYSHAWFWNSASHHRRPRLVLDRRKIAAVASTVLLVATFPVSLTTLAPLEIVARSPFVVTAPMDGAIESIPVEPSAVVKPGDVLVRFASTALKNRLEVAEREAEVADVRVTKTTLAAVTDMRARHELALAQAEYRVKVAERDYARDMLARSVITADRAGIAVFGDKRDLIGKPVATGERIMEIADPEAVDIRINVPVADAIVLGSEAKSKAFLDSAPLNPRLATVVSADYLAKPHDGGGVAFRVIARFNDHSPPPRLGLRGTAQLYGSTVPVIYYLLRRPIAAARQWTGI